MTPPTEAEARAYQLGWAAGWAAKDKTPLDVPRLHRAMVILDNDDPGVFNIVAISEPDTRDVADALASVYDALTP